MRAGERTGNRGILEAWLPPWIRSLGTPVWITQSNGRIGYFNERAEELLELSADDCVGRLCHKTIAGTDIKGRPFCGPNCRSLGLARKDREIEPVSMQIGAAGRKRHWVDVLHITLTPPERTGTWLVHCAIGADRAHRIETYLGKVAARSPHPEFCCEPLDHLGLTGRESEILQLLAEDENLHAIAEKTNVSYVTVRNHVQHILAKLGVHSIMEAVACYLLTKD